MIPILLPIRTKIHVPSFLRSFLAKCYFLFRPILAPIFCPGDFQGFHLHFLFIFASFALTFSHHQAMDLPRPPNVFSNLDLFCDWNGNPEEPVSITINIDAWGLPNLKLPVLNVHYPNVVKGPSQFVYRKTSQTHQPSKTHFNGDIFLHPTKRHPNGLVPDGLKPGSGVVVHDRGSNHAFAESPTPHRNAEPAHTHTFVPSICISQMYSEVDSSDSLTSPKSRKRSAKCASLPDSIPPDEDFGVSRHKALDTKEDSGVYQTECSPDSVLTPTPSSIHLPASPLADTETNGVSCEKLQSSEPSPKLSAAKPSVRFEELGPDGCSTATDTRGDTPESLPDYETPVLSPETSPSKTGICENANIPGGENFGPLDLTEENLALQDDRSESLRVCDGSLVDTEGTEEHEGSVQSFEPNSSTRDFTAITASPVIPHFPEQSDIPQEPELVLEDGIVYFKTPPGIEPKMYQIGITMEVILRKGKSTDWWELDVRGLPTLGSSESGYLYFRTNPGQGMEFGTLPFKRNAVVEDCLMAQFIPGKNLIVPLRNCSAEHYGFINDYKINSVLHSEIFQNSSGYAIEYTAVCSVDLINHRFWSEQCSFRMYVHGGPDGKWSGQFTEKQSFDIAGKPILYNLLLDPPADAEIGVSRIELTCPPAALEMFAVQWEMRVPRGKALITPRIKSTIENEAERKLRDNFDFVDRERYILANPWASSSSWSPRSVSRVKKAPSLARTKRFARQSDLQSLPAIALAGPTIHSVSTEPIPATTKPEEPKQPRTPEEPNKPEEPKKQDSTLSVPSQAMWRLVKFVFFVCWFLATLPSAYWSYIILSHGYTQSDSAFAFSKEFTPTILDQAEANVTSHSIESPIYNSFMQEEEVRSTIVPEPENTEKPHAGAKNNDTMPLRDRIDYFLGWKGPVVEE
ncbi:unnamed protein product [Penicillium salamii]|uniref:Uncharacterized protein n=1 Tax=Penicillium salamii TaxID=1612424 RepID=A0A9W4NS53_9EURO|nr:unnamed protein product [Penicillium salamii]CAG8352627.1 unnamed protein product [Penicillium salamii]CAG8357715.1 unnamed protein product [Penicillium salamii]CAG8402731.1 unnamed protein product [Penicillium salamii]